ncbi:uncharacterized protein LOC125717126 isoform X15 [Brienomyrus brachyistius]|uniref:uncharacterized protein LOC125717126 isoform X14 n=1 Tax=Brienomyrus brachyistius TaxID=42636 RepID=UPI0020B453B4|nr:uncharacterized protein LOC125717126 isoform X14 [Brienomyrus brachyistius]XP_048846143.1 uncharacterized protein LOC125717126 isoform X15 [Brienomyrus brachyistius]
MPPRISPLKDAIHYVVSKTDKTWKLDVKYINAEKGRGIFAKGLICKGDFVVEYRGEMINNAESQRRRKLYHPSCTAFMFAFKWRGKMYCIDASKEDGSFGRLVNDDHRHPNCRMKKIDVNGNPHLCLFALNDINEGEEISYDYGGDDCPWRKQTTSITANAMGPDDSRPSLLSKTPIYDATEPNNTPQQILSFANAMGPDDSRPSLLSKTPIYDATGPNNTPQQILSFANAMGPDDSRPSLLSKTPIYDATGPNNTPQQILSFANAMGPDDSRPSLLSKTPIYDATGPNNTPQQTTSITANAMGSDDSRPSLLSKTPIYDATEPNNTPQQIANEDEVFVPRLRRTKSIEMKDAVPDNSDELYDSTSGSNDDYIPDTTCESDSGSEYSFKQNLRTKNQSFDLLDVSGSVSSQVCDSTTPDKMTYDDHNLASEVTGAEEEPSSSQNVNDIMVVKALKKRGGNRIYNKKHYCLYCSKPYSKIARHLEGAHENKPDVAKALSFPKGSKERKKQLDYIRNRGNYAHNAAVMESGKGELVPFRRPHKEVQGKEFMHCAYCQGLFTRKVLWRHMHNCKLKPGSVTSKPGKNRVQSMCTYTGPVPSHVSKQLWGVIGAMNPDPVTDIIKNDQVIIALGQHLLNKGGPSRKNQQYVREKMREIGRLIYNASKVTTLKKLEDFINPKNYMDTVKAVKFTCGYDSETNKFLIPSLANKLGNALVKVSKLLKAQGLISNNKELVENASKSLDVHQQKWNEMISATALRNISEAKWNVPTLMPFTEDVQKMHAYLNEMQDNWYKSLYENPSVKAWIELTKVCMTQIILFNRRREGEVASMPLSAFLSRDTSDPHQDVDWALSEVERKLYRHFTRIVTRGKRGRPVPILLTPKMLCALELLAKQRGAYGVLKDNQYMFARPEAITHFRDSDCIRGFAKVCGAKCPESLTSTRLRKHAATLSTVLNMTDTEMDQLATFLGHDIRIHREFYRLPEKTLQLAKISKVLMALEQGRLAEFHGKNLDEIQIDPDEKVLDSDEEDFQEKCQADSSIIDEPSAEEILPPTERNEMPPPPSKRHKPLPLDDTSPSVVSTVRPSSKGKVTQKKRPWQQTEVQAVERHMNRFIISGIVPAKSDCERCLRAEPEALKQRNWENLKFYVYNRITAYKREIQRK